MRVLESEDDRNASLRVSKSSKSFDVRLLLIFATDYETNKFHRKHVCKYVRCRYLLHGLFIFF
jgi:hypothetical protein